MAKDTCIMCGEETPYEFETHIDLRHGYVEGAGQLCKDCYEDKPKENNIDKIKEPVTPDNTNDAPMILASLDLNPKG